MILPRDSILSGCQSLARRVILSIVYTETSNRTLHGTEDLDTLNETNDPCTIETIRGQ